MIVKTGFMGVMLGRASPRCRWSVEGHAALLVPRRQAGPVTFAHRLACQWIIDSQTLAAAPYAVDPPTGERPALEDGGGEGDAPTATRLAAQRGCHAASSTTDRGANPIAPRARRPGGPGRLAICQTRQPAGTLAGAGRGASSDAVRSPPRFRRRGRPVPGRFKRLYGKPRSSTHVRWPGMSDRQHAAAASVAGPAERCAHDNEMSWDAAMQEGPGPAAGVGAWIRWP
jgi:hypothetical protein